MPTATNYASRRYATVRCAYAKLRSSFAAYRARVEWHLQRYALKGERRAEANRHAQLRVRVRVRSRKMSVFFVSRQRCYACAKEVFRGSACGMKAGEA